MRWADISLSVRMWSVIRSGPVAQFMPTPSRSVIRDGSVERVDGLAAEHGAGAFDGDAGDYRNVDSEIARQLFHGHQARLEAAGVEAGFDEEIVGAALDEAFGLEVVIGAKFGEGGGAGDVEIFISGPDGAGDEARFGGGGILVGDLAREFGGGEVELVGAVFELVIGQRDARAAEGVGLDDVGAGFEILAMNILDDVGARDVEDLGTVLPPQVVGLDGQRRLMNHGAHGPVEDQDTLFQAIYERLLTLLGFGHRECAFNSLPCSTRAPQKGGSP